MKLLRRMRYFFRRNQIEAELAEEMEFHRAMLGSRPAMGNETLAREDARAVWIWPWLESVWQDIAFAARSMRRQPGFALVAIVALAAAIGLNTSLFTVFNAVALRPWQVPEPERMVRIKAIVKNPPKGFDNERGLSPAEFRYLEEHSKSMSGLFLTRGEGGLHLEGARVRVEYVTGNYFRAVGAGMQMGRGFLADEDRPGAPELVVVLSHRFWQNRLGSDPNILGRRVRIEEAPFTVVGVASPEFVGTSPEVTDVWVPLSASAVLSGQGAAKFLFDPHSCCADAGGRLARGMTREQTRAELTMLSANYWQQLNEKSDGITVGGTALLQASERKARQIYAVFGLMFTGVILVLLLACANVGNLLLARGAARRREIGVRLSLGAGRARVIRQLLTESLALACAAGALGVSLAYLAPAPLMRSAVGETSFKIEPDVTVLGYTFGLAVMACVAFGLAPALHATRGSFNEALKQQVALRSRFALRSVLLAVQVAVSVVLLIGAGLLVRGIQRVRSQDPGFAVQGIASVGIELPVSVYQGEALKGFYDNLTRALNGTAGIQPFGLTDIEPLGNTKSFTGFWLPGEDPKISSKTILASTVSPGFFELLSIPMMAGRNFTAADSGRNSVIVNQAMADRYFPGENPVGKIIFTGEAREIVGVVRNAHTSGLDTVEPFLYSPLHYVPMLHVLLRNTPANMAALGSAVKSLDTRAQLVVHPLSDNLDRWLSSARIGAEIAGLLGILALVLASIGVAGVFAYAVQQRTKEIGIRIALGARPGQVAGMVAGSAARPLCIGLAIGVAGAVAATRLIRPYLFGLSSMDAMTYAMVMATLALAGLAATFLPVRRAVRMDPVRALHYE